MLRGNPEGQPIPEAEATVGRGLLIAAAIKGGSEIYTAITGQPVRETVELAGNFALFPLVAYVTFRISDWGIHWIGRIADRFEHR